MKELFILVKYNSFTEEIEVYPNTFDSKSLAESYSVTLHEGYTVKSVTLKESEELDDDFITKNWD